MYSNKFDVKVTKGHELKLLITLNEVQKVINIPDKVLKDYVKTVIDDCFEMSKDLIYADLMLYLREEGFIIE